MSEKKAEVAEAPGVETKVETSETEVAKPLSREDIDQIFTEKDKRIVDLESQLKGVRKLQSETDKEVKRLREQPQSSMTTQLARDLVAAMEAQPKQTDDSGNFIPTPGLTRLKANVARMEYSEKQQQAFRQVEGEIRKIRQEAEEAGIDPDGEEFDTVVNAFKMHDIPEARRRTERLIKKHQGGKEQTMTGKAEEEKLAELRKQIEAETLKKYRIDGGLPSGGTPTFTREQIAQMSPAEYKEKRTEIAKAQREGKIK